MQDTKELSSKLGEMTSKARAKHARSRQERTSDENRDLRTTVELLRSQLDHEHEDLERLMSIIRDIGADPKEIRLDRPSVRGKRRGGWLRLAVFAGGAYVLGAKAGRQRYEQIRRWFDQARGRAREAADTAVDRIEG